jgi:NNP family nitrate/nitrite transporter-like MFS transporter
VIGRRSGFLASGHPPTLAAALLYFDVSFMAWVLLGPLAPFLREELGLSATQQGLLTAIPLLGGSVFRPALGLLADAVGGRRTGLVGLALTLVPLALGWTYAHTAVHFYALGLLLGIAGASFAVALPLASRWYPPHYQGLAMGIAGAGNSGTLLATLFAPRLAERFGWANTFGLAMLPVGVVLLLFWLMARDSPSRGPRPSLDEYRAVLREPDIVSLSFLYGLTFGGFVGLASFLTGYFHEQYQLSRVTAGDFTTVVVVAGSALRPVGGWLSDRMGGYRLLVGLLAGFAACLAVVAMTPPPLVALGVLFVGMGLLGTGNGAVFQLVPQRFSGRIGIATGIVGAAGGLGGFFLPSVLGVVKDVSGQYTAGFLLFAAAFLAGTFALLELGTRWSQRWHPEAVRQAGVFSYRAVPRRAPSEGAA